MTGQELVTAFAPLLPIAAVLCGGALITIALYVARGVTSKMGLDSALYMESIERALRDAVDHGIAYAEQWAAQRRSAGVESEGAEKLVQAIDWVEREIEDQKLPTRGAQWIERAIEARLGHPEAPAGITAKKVRQ